jgi:hypothetical protein
MYSREFSYHPSLQVKLYNRCTFLKEYGINVNFERGSTSYAREGCFTEQLFDQHQGQEIRSNDQSSEGNPNRNTSPKGQQSYNPTADRKYPTPSTAFHSHQHSTEPQTERGRISPERDSGTSGPINGEEFSSVNEEKGNSTLINGAESDRICCEES